MEESGPTPALTSVLLIGEGATTVYVADICKAAGDDLVDFRELVPPATADCEEVYTLSRLVGTTGMLSLVPHSRGTKSHFVAYVDDNGMDSGRARNIIAHGVLYNLGFRVDGLVICGSVVIGRRSGVSLTRTDLIRIRAALDSFTQTSVPLDYEADEDRSLASARQEEEQEQKFPVATAAAEVKKAEFPSAALLGPGGRRQQQTLPENTAPAAVTYFDHSDLLH